MLPGIEAFVELLSIDGPAGAVGSRPPASTDFRRLLAPVVLDRGAERLVARGATALCYASTTTSYAIGFDAEAALASRLEERFSVPVASTGVAAVEALRSLGVERLALVGAPWFDPEFNELGAAYFRAQRFDVVSSRSARLVRDPDRIDSGAVYDWVSRNVPDDAQAAFIGGNGFRAAAAIERLEATLGRPVVTANQALLAALLARTAAPEAVEGYGRLLCRRPGDPARTPRGSG